MKVDVLAIGPHPDDADLGLGGILCKLAARGFTTSILDLTRGELGTRGTPVERATEAAESARILGISLRENAGLPDGALANTPEQRERVVHFIRRLRPKVLLIPNKPDRHPDHEAAHELCRAANFYAGVEKVCPDSDPWRAESVYFYGPYQDAPHPPTFVVDVSGHFEAKLEALATFRSQFYNPDYNGEETAVSSRAFWDSIRHRAAYWGSRVGVQYGEALYSEGPLALDILPGLR